MGDEGGEHNKEEVRGCPRTSPASPNPACFCLTSMGLISVWEIATAREPATTRSWKSGDVCTPQKKFLHCRGSGCERIACHCATGASGGVSCTLSGIDLW